MTQYTSFVAVDTIVRDTGELVTVKQPLPLPEGVSDYAVGDSLRKAAAPSSGFVKTLSVKEDADYHLQDQERKRGPSQLYIMGGKLPPGITMEGVERVFSPFKQELEKAFKKWDSKKLVVLLNIEGGRVRSIQGKGHNRTGTRICLIAHSLFDYQNNPLTLLWPASLKAGLPLFVSGIIT